MTAAAAAQAVTGQAFTQAAAACAWHLKPGEHRNGGQPGTCPRDAQGRLQIGRVIPALAGTSTRRAARNRAGARRACTCRLPRHGHPRIAQLTTRAR